MSQTITDNTSSLPADALSEPPDQSAGELVEARQGPTRERWLAHAEFCRRQSVVWEEFAQNERNPERRNRFLRDAKFNFETALFAIRMALSSEDSR